ncbi:unnamed protein product [Didymodactylos carnosus]|uniref:EF-hand domain-containing protein n=1 Tax=Didymodactylos carnosus TaxID=1234261 RepID=A0A814MFJ6_9BILA|nr:unnamed protein product [Didymodactylos carnosus]CAF1078257.1 unnamed protein product [Didymodactylos carnosus]CAF3692674.1 unnamed protein product [Didymodactylos carnosus]CAF3844495.1 unnamed protein product [Didymodactylos carnosus]
MGNILHRKHGEHYLKLNDEMITRAKMTTNFNETEINEYHHKFFSIASDGKLKKSLLNDILGDYLPGDKKSRSKYLSDSIFKAIDQDDNGYMDFFEYLYALKFLTTESPIEKAEFIYKILDRNGDKIVTQKEIYRILKSLESYHQSINGNNSNVNEITANGSKQAANVILEKLDEDKSGSITPSEFMDGYLKDDTIRALFAL